MNRNKITSILSNVKKTSTEKTFRKTNSTNNNKKRYKSNNKQLLSHYFITLIYINSDCFTKNSSILEIDEFMHIKIVFSTRWSWNNKWFLIKYSFLKTHYKCFTKKIRNFFCQFIWKYVLFFNYHLSHSVITLIWQTNCNFMPIYAKRIIIQKKNVDC